MNRQLELFNRISDSVDNLKKLGKDNINLEVLEMHLENHLIILSKSVVGSENSDCYKYD